MTEIDRGALRELVTRWVSGELNACQVHEIAEDLWDAVEAHQFAREDPRSIAIEVLSQLDILNHQLITPDDIPAILEFLETPVGAEMAGWNRWVGYWDGLDLDARIQTLKDDPYYSAYALPKRTYDKDEVS